MEKGRHIKEEEQQKAEDFAVINKGAGNWLSFNLQKEYKKEKSKMSLLGMPGLQNQDSEDSEEDESEVNSTAEGAGPRKSPQVKCGPVPDSNPAGLDASLPPVKDQLKNYLNRGSHGFPKLDGSKANEFINQLDKDDLSTIDEGKRRLKGIIEEYIIIKEKKVKEDHDKKLEEEKKLEKEHKKNYEEEVKRLQKSKEEKKAAQEKLKLSSAEKVTNQDVVL